jgi:NAD(P)-dependent dehydrogenase (short-subunit alcohol dehydrogenase family)
MRWVITGANRGIGLALARQLTERGEEVIATARNPATATELVALGGRVVPLDVQDDDSVQAFAQALGNEPIDVLINNAGMAIKDGLGNLDFEGMKSVIDTNTVGPLRVLQAVLPQIKSSGSAKVINITSRMGSIEENSSGGMYAYRISKAALNMAISVSSIDLKEAGVTVIGIHPGWVKTDMGGTNAQVDVDDSAASILSTVDGLTVKDTGRFMDRDGSAIPW